jgi:pimeloyl-ACP methyl ester carboxylesterase
VRSQRVSKLCRSSVVVGAALGVLGTAGTVTAQALKDVQTPDTPLVLKAQGSFFVGGDKAEQTRVELGDLGPGGHITINQMYVRYMVPQGGDGNAPVVMVHGATLTGKSWETTPDGRMGWDEYFVRRGHPVYVPDQVGRARSGFNQAAFNNVRAGSAQASGLPRWLRFSDEVAWPNFRFGSKPGAPYTDSQFPVTAVDELSKQGVPDVSFGGLPTPNPNLKALSDLATQVNGAVLMGHSQSGAFPLGAALLNPAAAKGLVLVEPVVVRPVTATKRSRRWPRFPFSSSSATTVTRRQVSGRSHSGGGRSRAARHSSADSRLLAARQRCSARQTPASAATVT